jgi:hypothetical protein
MLAETTPARAAWQFCAVRLCAAFWVRAFQELGCDFVAGNAEALRRLF